MATTPEEVEKQNAQLRQELEFYKQLIAGNRDGLWHQNLVTGELWCSERWWQILGYAHGSTPKHIDNFKQMVHPEDLSKVEEALKRHLEGTEPEYICRYRLKDGKGEWRIVLSRGKSENPDCISGSHFDITINAVKEQEEKTLDLVYDRVFHSIPHLIIVKDEQDRFVYANKALAEFWGENDPAKLKGKKDEDYNPDKEEVATFLRADAEVRRTKRPLTVAIERNTDSRGKKHWLNTIKVPLVNDDGSVYLIVVATFIDDVMEMAEKVKKQEELPKLARILAHKLGTRIFTLRNLVSIVQHDADADDLEQAFDDVTKFAEDFLKLTSADMIQRQPMNLLSLVYQVLKAFAEKAKISLNNRSVSSVRDSVGKFGSPPVYEMIGDANKLYDVISELVKNSLGWRREETHRISVSVKVQMDCPNVGNLPWAGRFQIVVEDNGQGVPADRKRSIFQPFVSGRGLILADENYDPILAARTDKSSSGTGLGLAIAEEVIKSHGGTIKEEGTHGQGARFVITLSKNPPSVQPSYSQSPAIQP